jgi:hypothetical protein
MKTNIYIYHICLSFLRLIKFTDIIIDKLKHIIQFQYISFSENRDSFKIMYNIIV